MHLHIHAKIFGIVIGIVFDRKGFACIFVLLQCKSRKRDQIDSIAFLQRIQIAVAGRHPDYICNAGKGACCSTHPDNVVISPLHIHAVIMTQCMQNNMRPRSSVVNIPYDMQMVDDKPLDQFAEGNDKIRRSANTDDRMYDLIVIPFLILHLCLFCDQFFNDVGKILRKRFTHLGSRIFGGNVLCDLHQTI